MVSRKKTSRRKSKSQKIYKMKGCNKKSRKTYLGGSLLNAAAYPNPGPASGGFNFLNPQNTQSGGNCGTAMCTAPLAMLGGGKHRTECKCSTCKKTIKGGSGIPYPNGLVGSGWTSDVSGWPGVGGISGNRNYLLPNTYPTDPQTEIIDTGAQPPFSVGGKRKKGQKGGTLSNFLAQDLLNLGRQIQYGLGTTYNALAGYASPVNPMPWKNQLSNSANISTIKAAYV